MLRISKVFYRIILKLYYSGALFFSLFNSKAAKWVAGQNKTWDELRGFKKSGKAVWIHCASLGEFEQARPVIESIETKFPGTTIVLTFFSPSGYEIVKEKLSDHQVYYLPFDSPDNAQRLIQHIDPILAIFVKYDLWYYYLKTLEQKKIPTILISAVFNSNAIFFKWYGALFREMLNSFTKIFVQDNTSVELLKQYGYSQIVLSGDTRIDRVIDILANKEDLPRIKNFVGEKKVFIAGSIEPKDEPLIVRLINESENPEYKYIIAPHDISPDYVQHLVHEIKIPVITFSNKDMHFEDYKVLIIDNIGMLSSLYQYADLAYIGGGFDKGIHNILEPAVYGIPIIFGPQFDKFREAKDLVEIKGSFEIKNFDDLLSIFSMLNANNAYYRKAGETSRKYILENAGATKKIMQHIEHWLEFKP